MLDIAGLADSSATVTVNSQSTQREGEHWFKQLALSGNAAQWQSVAVYISSGGGTSGSVLLKEHPEVYAYDDDGNLISDGRWTYAWDADGARQRGDGAPKARPKGRGGRVPFGRTAWQNRLKRMETVSSAYTAGAPRKRIDYAYDDRGRRTLKSVYTWNTSTSAFNTTPAVKVGFLYHDWNLLQEVDLSASSPATLRSYYWGLDLSGTLQGAGGVGGLLAADLDAASYSTAFYATDANGNVSDLAWALGDFAAHYEYDAFGNTFPENAGWLNLASLNPFRFSTKYTETDAASGGNETGLLYYGYRYYNPSTGRWLGRDPIQERGGLNLYGMVRNDPVGKIDILGLDELTLSYDLAADDSGPIGAKEYDSWAEVLADAKKRVKDCHCIKLLRVGGHGAPGQFSGGPGSSAGSDLTVGTFRGNDAADKNPKLLAIKSFREDHDKIQVLHELKKLMCKDGKIEVVACNLFAGDRGQDFKGNLEDIFGQGNVEGYEYPVVWGFYTGDVYHAYEKPNGNVSHKEKVRCSCETY